MFAVRRRNTGFWGGAGPYEWREPRYTGPPWELLWITLHSHSESVSSISCFPQHCPLAPHSCNTE